MFIKRKGYILVNSINLIIFITILLIGGMTIFKMNLRYSTKYNIYGSIRDLDTVQKNIIEITNRWIEENIDELKNNMNKDMEYKISNEEYNIKLFYYKNIDTFKISYGKTKIENYMYCNYNKYFVNEEDTEEGTQNFKINLMLKREVLIGDTK